MSPARAHPDQAIDVSAGICAEMIECVAYRAVFDQGEVWKIAIRTWRQDKQGKLVPVIHDWITGATLDECFNRLAPRPAQDSLWG
jgi:hypothetical protein